MNFPRYCCYKNMRQILFSLPLLAAALLYANTPEAGRSPLRYLEEQADSGNPEAMYRLSYLLETGHGGVDIDSVRADTLLRAAAAAGYAQACNLLGYRYFGQSPDSMLMWIERAATATPPDPKAFNNLGWLLSTGSGGVHRDMKKALYWYEKGAGAGVPTAMASLASLLLDSPDVPHDSVRARELLHDAARKGFRPAAQRLYLLIEPEINRLDSAQLMTESLAYFDDGIFDISTPLLMKAANADDPYALALLAQCYAQGWGVPYDYSHAMHLFRHAALRGDPSAAYIIGETLQQFPDIFVDESAPDPLGRTGVEWIEQATGAGIDDAHKAIIRLTPAVMR